MSSLEKQKACRVPAQGHRTPIALAVMLICWGGAAHAQTASDTETSKATLPMVTVQASPDSAAAERSYTAPEVSVGTKLPATMKEIPQSVTVVTRERMDDQNLTTLNEVMAQTTGVTVDLSATGVIPAFYARGYPIEYFSYDGVPIQTGGASWGQPDMIMFDRVEMQRGAAGLFTGAGQPGGVINLVRKRPTKEAQFSGSVGVGSWNARRGEIDYSTPLNASGSVRTRFAASYDRRDSHVDYANSQSTNFYGIIEADITSSTTVSAGIGYSKRDWLPAMMGMPRYKDGSSLNLSRSTFLSTPWTYWNFETTQLFADVVHNINADWQLKASIVSDHETSDLKYAYVSGAVDPVTKKGPALAGGANDYDNKQLAVDVMLAGKFNAFGKKHELVVGTNWYERDADAMGGRLPNFGGTPVDVFNFNPGAIADPGAPVWTSSSRTTTKQYGIYGATRLKLADPLTLILGGRMSWWKTQSYNLLTNRLNSEYEQNAQFTPYAGIVYAINPTWSLYTSYSDIFRSQSNNKDSDGKSLDPVTGTNYEAGIKGEFYEGKLNTALSVFRITEKNRAVLVSPLAVDGCCYATSGEVRSEGAELEASGQLTSNWQVAAGYTFNTTKYLSDKTNTGKAFNTFTPKHLLRVWTTYRLPGELQAWNVGGGINAQTGVYTQGGNPVVRAEQASYVLASLRVGYEINKHWSAGLNINNLFDRTYYTRLGSGGFGPTAFGNVYGEPRSVMLTLRAKY